MRRVYVAGPFSGEVMKNTREAVLVGQQIIKRGHSAYIPHLSAFIDFVDPTSYEETMTQCFVWIEACHALFLIAPSPGADREVAFCEKKGIPVFTDMNKLVRYLDQLV